MALYKFTNLFVVVVVVVAAALCGMDVAAQSSSDDCTNVLISMSPCLDYISGNSSAPSSGCCTQLGTVVRSQPRCLCQVLNGGGANLGLNINQTQALALPRACNVQTPPASQCNGGAGGSPSGSPGSSTPSAGGGGGDGGSKTVPSGDNNGSSDSTTMSVSLLLSLVFFGCYYVVFA